ncbi:MAG: hypothetical protein EXR76_12105 [Myxococcales bacterium]|nr:hypothetical protein [Myxococcales bacterium]
MKAIIVGAMCLVLVTLMPEASGSPGEVFNFRLKGAKIRGRAATCTFAWDGELYSESCDGHAEVLATFTGRGPASRYKNHYALSSSGKRSVSASADVSRDAAFSLLVDGFNVLPFGPDVEASSYLSESSGAQVFGSALSR